MSALDLLDGSIVHGTAAGYDAGCHTAGGCPGSSEEFGQTCTEAKTRSRSEFRYGKAVANGREVEYLRAERHPAAQVFRAPAVDPDIAVAVDQMQPTSVGERVAIERTLQDRRDRVEVEPVVEDAPAPKPVARRKPVAPTPVAPDLDQWPEPSAPQPAGSLAKSRGAFAAHPKQRDHALATATREHPMGLTLTGEPRRRCAPGTVLIEGVLRRSDDAANVLTSAPPAPEAIAESDPIAPTPDQAEADEPDAVAAEESVEAEEPRPRGKRVLDDALRTLAEAAELQRAIAGIAERALRTARIEINQMRREAAAHENQQEK